MPKPKKSSQLIYMLHNPEPDYTRPLFEIPSEARERMFNRLRFLYSEDEAKAYMPELERTLRVYYAHKPQEMIEAEKDFDPKERFTEKDMILITYGDLVRGEEGHPLAVLHSFVNTHNRGAVNILHILPFFPYSSDRGFSITDFRAVDPKLGTWKDISDISCQYQLMFDGVLNHASSQSKMFKEFLNGHPYYKDFFISYTSPDDLTPDQRSKIFRPRTSDIITEFQTIDGPRYVWTTLKMVDNAVAKAFILGALAGFAGQWIIWLANNTYMLPGGGLNFWFTMGIMVAGVRAFVPQPHPTMLPLYATIPAQQPAPA